MVTEVIIKIRPGLRANLAMLPCVIAIQALTAVAAHASCGDWLQHPADPTPAVEIASLDVAQANENPAFGSPLLIYLPKPCDGPNCRQAPSRPMHPVPVIVVVCGERLGLVANADPDHLKLQQFGTVCERCLHAAKGFLPRIEHPPRV